MQITSKDNEMVRRMHRLLTDAKARRKEGALVIEGARLCEDAARSGVGIETALITEKARDKYPRQTAAVAEVAAHVFDITDGVADSLSDTVTSQGVFCLCKALDNRKMLDTILEVDILSTLRAKRWLALEDVRDPGNMGTVIRTAEAMGVGVLILSAGCCDVSAPKVVRGSMGGVFRLPIYETADLPGTLSRLEAAGCATYACVPAAESRERAPGRSAVS